MYERQAFLHHSFLITTNTNTTNIPNNITTITTTTTTTTNSILQHSVEHRHHKVVLGNDLIHRDYAGEVTVQNEAHQAESVFYEVWVPFKFTQGIYSERQDVVHKSCAPRHVRRRSSSTTTTSSNSSELRCNVDVRPVVEEAAVDERTVVLHVDVLNVFLHDNIHFVEEVTPT